jgi:hypothetical protein
MVRLLFRSPDNRKVHLESHPRRSSTSHTTRTDTGSENLYLSLEIPYQHSHANAEFGQLAQPARFQCSCHPPQNRHLFRCRSSRRMERRLLACTIHQFDASATFQVTAKYCRNASRITEQRCQAEAAVVGCGGTLIVIGSSMRCGFNGEVET